MGKAHEHDYDPCREYLRLIVAVLTLLIAALGFYPIYLGVTCNHLYQSGDESTVPACLALVSATNAIILLVGSAVVIAVAIAVFFYTCRYEYCWCNRRYDDPFVCCERAGDQNEKNAQETPRRVGFETTTSMGNYNEIMLAPVEYEPPN